MYLKQFPKDTAALLKYLPFVVGFLGFMAVNVIVSNMMQIDSGKAIEESINRLGKNITFFTLLLPFTFFMLLLYLWWRFIHQQTLKALTTARKKVDWNRIFFSFTAWFLLNGVLIAISYIQQPDDFQFQFNTYHFLALLFISVLFVPIQTSFEEYFFRGYFMQFVAYLSKNRGVALFISSIVFGLMHLGNPEVADMGLTIMIYYIGCGLFLGIMTLMDDSLELALGFHAANNLFGSLIITTKTAVFQTDALFVYHGASNITEILIQVFIIFPILLLVFSRKYHWANWKQKLFKSI